VIAANGPALSYRPYLEGNYARRTDAIADGLFPPGIMTLQRMMQAIRSLAKAGGRAVRASLTAAGCQWVASLRSCGGGIGGRDVRPHGRRDRIVCSPPMVAAVAQCGTRQAGEENAAHREHISEARGARE